MKNLLPALEDESIESYTRRLVAHFTNPKSAYWHAYRAHAGLNLDQWRANRGRPADNVMPYPKTSWDINCGHCETFCNLLEMNFPGGEELWFDELFLNDPRTRPEGFSTWTEAAQTEWFEENDPPTHCLYKKDGRYYDSENPDGVTDWMELEVWKNRGKGRERVLIETELKAAMAEMAEMTAPECAACPVPHSCCGPEYCQITASYAQKDWGITLPTTGHPKLPFMGWDGEKSTGCTVAPHLRPLCTLHTCAVNSLGFKKGDMEWTDRYHTLRERIDVLSFRLAEENLPK